MSLTFRGKPVVRPNDLDLSEQDLLSLRRLAEARVATGEEEYFIRSRAVCATYEKDAVRETLQLTARTGWIDADAVLGEELDDGALAFFSIYGHLGPGTHYVLACTDEAAVFEEVTIDAAPSERIPAEDDTDNNPLMELVSAEEESYKPCDDVISFFFREIMKHIAKTYQDAMTLFLEAALHEPDDAPQATSAEGDSIIIAKG